MVYVDTRLLCDMCKVYEEGAQKYCRECDQYICTLCYSKHQRINECQGHQTYTCLEKNSLNIELPLSRKVLVHKKTQKIYWDRLVKRASFFRLYKTVKVSVLHCSSSGHVDLLTTENLEDNHPQHKLHVNKEYLSELKDDDIRITTVYRQEKGFTFIVSDVNTTVFVKGNVPINEKLRHFTDLALFNCSKISYQIKENTDMFNSRMCGVETLFTEFDDGIAILVDENGPKFGLAPLWSIFCDNSRIMRLQSPNDGHPLLQKPSCMTFTIENTFVICDSRRTSGCITEFNMEGNMMSKVHLNKEVSGSILSVTADDENNIYVSSEKEVVQISDTRDSVRELLSLKRSTDYDDACIKDICFSMKTRTLYVMIEKDGEGNVLSFKFVEC